MKGQIIARRRTASHQVQALALLPQFRFVRLPRAAAVRRDLLSVGAESFHLQLAIKFLTAAAAFPVPGQILPALVPTVRVRVQAQRQVPVQPVEELAAPG